jgi:hypothetical protein
MNQKCLGCGVEKDMDVLEPYPYPEDERLVEGPIVPLFVLDCEPSDRTGGKQWKAVVVCHECFKRLDPDMWISERCWININPVVPFDELPLTKSFDDENKWQPQGYVT